MNPLPHFLFLLLLVLPQQIGSQTIELSGKVMDNQTGSGLPFATITLLNTTGGTITDVSGHFKLTVRRLPTTLIVSSIGYRSDSIQINQNNYLEINLRVNTTALPQIEVTASKKWEILNKEKVFPLDFTVCQNRLFVLGKRGIGRKYHLASYSPDGKLLFERELSLGKITGIETNCFDHLAITTPEFAIRLDASELQPVDKTPLRDYQKLFANCRASNDDFVYLEKSRFRGLNKLYLIGERYTGAISTFKRILFHEALQLTRQSRGFLATVDANNNMGDITYDENQAIREQEDNADFLRQVLLNNNNINHLFSFQDTVLLFNFDEDHIEFFNTSGDSLTVVPIRFNGKTMARSPKDAPVFRDPITGQFYTILIRKGRQKLFGVDILTGQVTQEYSLEVADLEKFAVLNGMAYLLGVPLRNRQSAYQRFLQKPLLKVGSK